MNNFHIEFGHWTKKVIHEVIHIFTITYPQLLSYPHNYPQSINIYTTYPQVIHILIHKLSTIPVFRLSCQSDFLKLNFFDQKNGILKFHHFKRNHITIIIIHHFHYPHQNLQQNFSCSSHL